MWSDKYNYYNIQFDEKFSQKLEKKFVVKCLLETNLFKQTNHQSLRNLDNFPWAEIVLVETQNGNFATSEKENLFVSLIAIVCLKNQKTNQQVYIDTFIQIAEKLNWKLYLERDDDGNENIEIKK